MGRLKPHHEIEARLDDYGVLRDSDRNIIICAFEILEDCLDDTIIAEELQGEHGPEIRKDALELQAYCRQVLKTAAGQKYMEDAKKHKEWDK